MFWKSTIKPGGAQGNIHRENPRKLFFMGHNHSARFPCIPLDVEHQNSTILEQDPDPHVGVWVWREVTRIP